MKPPVICIMGPTASGKTALAVELIEHLPVEIISVDSAMVYRGMDIGTAKPDAETLAKAPHRLIDICDPADAYSAARFREDALKEIQEINQQNKIPLLVGGTMLYFRSILQGLSPLPAANAQVRKQLENEAKEKGWDLMHQRLQRVDAESAAKIHPNDPQRLQRALEVFELTGQPLSQLKRQTSKGLDADFEIHKFALLPSDRRKLHQQIERRFNEMLDIGLVDEVRQLYQRKDLHPNLPAIKSVGYRQVWQYLAGELDYVEMKERGIIATRQLAKRQHTWLRSEPSLMTFTAKVGLLPQIMAKLAGKV